MRQIGAKITPCNFLLLREQNEAFLRSPVRVGRRGASRSWVAPTLPFVAAVGKTYYAHRVITIWGNVHRKNDRRSANWPRRSPAGHFQTLVTPPTVHFPSIPNSLSIFSTYSFRFFLQTADGDAVTENDPPESGTIGSVSCKHLKQVNTFVFPKLEKSELKECSVRFQLAYNASDFTFSYCSLSNTPPFGLFIVVPIVSRTLLPSNVSSRALALVLTAFASR